MAGSLFLSADQFGGTALFDEDQLFGLDDIAVRPLTGHANWEDDADWFNDDKLAGQPNYVAPKGVLPSSLSLTTLLLAAFMGTPWAASASAGTSSIHPFKATNFDPSTLALKLWVQGGYGVPTWAGTASAGTSGTQGGLITAGADPTGSSEHGYTDQNGITPANFNGTTQYLKPNGNVQDIWTSTSTGTIIALIKAPNAAAAPGTFPYSDAMIIGDDSSFFGMSYNSEGIQCWVTSGGLVKMRRATLPADGQWHIVMMRWDGTNLGLTVDRGLESKTPCGAVDTIAGQGSVGRNAGGTVYFKGQIMEIMALATTLSLANFTNLITYAESRYRITIGAGYPAFAYKDLGTDLFALWDMANATDSGGQVSLIPNTSGNGNSARNLVWVASNGTAFNHSSVHMNSLNSHGPTVINLKLQATFDVTQPQPYTTYHAIYLPAITSKAFIRTNAGNYDDSPGFVFAATTRVPAIQVKTTGAQVVTGSADPGTGLHICCCVYNGASSAIYIDDMTTPVTGGSGTIDGNGCAIVTLGSFAGTPVPLWESGDFLIVNGAHDTIMRHKIGAFMGDKYGVYVK